MTWACLWLASLSDWRVKVAMAGAYMFALMSAVTFNPTNGFAGWSRRQATLDWRAHVQQCAMAAEYKLPIHTTGAPNALWYVPLSGAQCRNLIDRSLTRSLRGPRKLLSPRVA